MFAARPVHESGLDAGVAPGRGRPRIWGIWSRRRWLDVVLAVQPEPLDHFERVLLVLIYVRVCGFKESGGRLHRCVRRLDRPIALKAGDSHLDFDRSSHSATSKGSLGCEFIRSGANVEGDGVRSVALMSCYNLARPSSGRCALTEWPLRDAKNKFSALVNAALAGEPQLVTRRGQPAVVVLAADEYERLRLLDNAGASTLGELLLAIPQDGQGFERMVDSGSVPG